MSVLVDDSDPFVKYNSQSGWEKWGLPSVEFNGTTHASATRGDTATLEFQGTSISVYGSLGPSAPGARLNFSLDGLDAGSFIGNGTPRSQHNQLFWTSSTVQEASHTLVVTVDHDTATPQVNQLNRTFFLDYFIYNTSSVNAPGTKEFIDDTDAKVIYSDHWNAGKDDGSLQGTFHTNKLPGAWAAIKFQGTSISLFGATSGNLSYVIDSLPPVTIPARSRLSGLVFQSNGLSSSSHTLNITALSPADLAIDSFFVATAGGNATSSQSSQSSTATSRSEASPTSSSPQQQKSHAAKLPSVIGGVVGGVVLLVLISAFVLLRRRRNRARNNDTRSGSLMSRWLRRQDPQAGIIVRPFRSSLPDSENLEQPPPPYTLKHLPIVGRSVGV
ncbi:hypothetical protein R3P38DRAFT_1299656 [Favolaschia claudopus]|uniref:Transmembrane protein n=1 Tax=Favolaschia claudopus TaxID=2862362 RepID=A0AAW0AY57_9AGAR